MDAVDGHGLYASHSMRIENSRSHFKPTNNLLNIYRYFHVFFKLVLLQFVRPRIYLLCAVV